MNKIDVKPVILCGGVGSRLWPLSSETYPKQFLSLIGNESLFQLAARRLTALCASDIDVARPLIVTGERHRFLVSEQLREVDIEASNLVLEPIGRNTAPALTMAALAAKVDDQDPVLVVTPADQAIGDLANFTHAIKQAVYEAALGSIVLIGVKPDQPQTGYGYIQVDSTGNEVAKTVKCFVEKPNAIAAQQYLLQGDYFWNAGMFVVKASIWLEALAKFRPDILMPVGAAWGKRTTDGKFVRPCVNEFAAVPSESADYAVLESCPGSNFSTKMIVLEGGWSDLGSWSSFWNLLPRDKEGNAHQGDVLTTNCRNTMAYASSRLVYLAGVQNVVVVETPDSVLVCDMAAAQDIKHIPARLGEGDPEREVIGRRVHRPWGWYSIIKEGIGFKVKHIHVNPEASLSLQKHHSRSEHWAVVSGTAEVTIGKKIMTLMQDQSAYVPTGEVHRLTNSANVPLQIIETQIGSYLGEDDIVRIEDNYGRVT
jgi:mannose-1-phosphate guanylyltransferase/mannose-6-phosphate isomerase